MESISESFKVWCRSEWIYWTYSKIKFNIQKYVDKTFEATEIIDNFWLGALKSSSNKEALQERNIDTIISAVLGASAMYPFDFRYERAKLRDVVDENIIDEFDKWCHKQLTGEYKAKWQHFLRNLRKLRVKLIVSVNEDNMLFNEYVTDVAITTRYIRQNKKYVRILHNQTIKNEKIYIKIETKNKIKRIIANKYYDIYDTFKKRNVHYY